MRRTAKTALAVTALMWVAAPAWAHVELTASEAPAGSTTELEFELGHGCDGSPVVGLAIQIPEGVTDVTPGDREGWTASTETVDGLEVVRWEGGPQPAEEHGHFHISVTLPDAEGEVLAFPAVQTCEEGEVAWIGLPNADGTEPENPAPLLTLVAGDATAAPTTTEAEHDHSEEEEGDHDHADTTVAVTETTAAPATTVVAADEVTATTGLAAVEPARDGSDDIGLFAGIAAAIAVVGGGTSYLARKRKTA